VLSFDTTHAVTGCLLEADAHAESRGIGFGGPPVLLLLHDRPLTSDGPRHTREIRAAAFTLHPRHLAEHVEGLPGVVHDLAAALADPGAPASTRTAGTADADYGIRADDISYAASGARLLAWAVLYDDVLASTDGIHHVRRVDAVDIDGRVYQISRLRGEAIGVVVIDEQPDPDDIPATQPGLTALLAASQQRDQHARQGAQP
jgi:hypothetical protein